MAACEKCWGDAYRAEMRGGGSQSEHYERLIKERKSNPCSKAEQVFGGLCSTLRTDNAREMTADINMAIDRFVKPLEEEIEKLKSWIAEHGIS